MYFKKASFYSMALIVFILIFVSCAFQNKDDKTIIQIGDFKISAIELKNEFLVQSYTPDNKKENKIPKVTAEKWLEEYIDDCYLTAEAYNLNYYNDSVKILADFIEKLMISSISGEYASGYLFNNINVSDEEVNNSLSKSLQMYEIQRFEFPSIEKMKVILGKDTIIDTPAKFEMVKKKLHSTKYYISNYSSYPHNHFPGLKDIIDTMELNSVSKPFLGHDGPYLYSIYILYKKQVENYENPQISAYKLKNILKTNLYNYYKETILYNNIKTYLKLSHYTINYNILYKLYSEYEKTKSNIIEDVVLSGIMDSVILSYQLKGKTVNKTAKDIAFAHNNYFMIGRIANMKEMKEVVLDQIIFDYFYSDAEKKGFTDNKNFNISKKRFTNKMVKNKYLQDQVYSKISCSENELLEFYNKKSQMFSDGMYADIGLLYFNNEKEALQSTYDLRENRPVEFKKDSIPQDIWKKVIKYNLDETVSRNSDKYNEDIINKIFSMKNREVSKPYVFNNEIFIIIKKNESGSYIYPFEMVRADITKALENIKKEEEIKKLVEALKSKYKIKAKSNLIEVLGY